MPIYTCYGCGTDTGDPKKHYCDPCLEKITAADPGPQLACLKGCSDGPGSRGISYWRPDPLKECRRTAKIMEEQGKLNDPKAREAVQTKLKALEAQEPTRKKLDYQERGGEDHPLYGVNR